MHHSSTVICIFDSGDRLLEKSLKGYHALKCFRYVDDFLLCLPSSSNTDCVAGYILDLFRAAHNGPEFTFEMPADNQLQLLDLSLSNSDGPTCWCYRTRSQKRIMTLHTLG